MTSELIIKNLNNVYNIICSNFNTINVKKKKREREK